MTINPAVGPKRFAPDSGNGKRFVFERDDSQNFSCPARGAQLGRARRDGLLGEVRMRHGDVPNLRIRRRADRATGAPATVQKPPRYARFPYQFSGAFRAVTLT